MSAHQKPQFSLVEPECFPREVADVTVAEFPHGRAQVTESAAMLQQILDALPAAVYTTDAKGRVTYCNRAAVELAGREPALGRDEWCVTWRLLTPEGEPLSHSDCPMATTLKENRPVRGVEAVAERPDGSRVPFLPFPTPLRDGFGNLVGAVNMLVDISERREAETRQKALLAELNHRVKNNMQMLHALLRAAQRETASAEAKAALADAGQRVGAMAAAQQVLYDSLDSTAFDAASFMDAVCRNARQSFGRRVDIRLETCEAVLKNDVAIPLALIVNELIASAIRHNDGGDKALSIAVGLTLKDGMFRLTVAHDGTPFDTGDMAPRASGLGLVNGLATQLRGVFHAERGKDAVAIVEFPAAAGA
jgi:PAS domain S-box-containing protein